MFNLAGPVKVIGVGLQEQEMAIIKSNFLVFKAEYDKVSKTVPDSTVKFPLYPITLLGTAVDSGNPAQIDPAIDSVGKICSDCHLVNQGEVEQ